MSKHFYHTVRIENFRGIKSLELDGLERVNLFVGKNNCDKTSVLESVFLLTGMSYPELCSRIGTWRGLIYTRGTDLENLFYGQAREGGIVFYGKQVIEDRKLEIFPLFEPLSIPQDLSNRNESERVQTEMISSTTEQLWTGIKSNFTYSEQGKKDKSYEATMRFERQKNGEFKINIEQDEEYKESTPGRFIRSQGYDANLVDEMLNQKLKTEVINCLQSIEPKVQDIRTTMHGIVAVDIGLDKFLPINYLGDGTVRIMAILSSIYGTKNGILMIDEIENGLHVSSIKHLWEVVLAHSKKTNTQIFMTTHSHDVITGLNLALKDKQDSVACFWLSKFDTDEVKAYRYAPDELDKALDAGIDIRH